MVPEYMYVYSRHSARLVFMTGTVQGGVRGMCRRNTINTRPRVSLVSLSTPIHTYICMYVCTYNTHIHTYRWSQYLSNMFIPVRMCVCASQLCRQIDIISQTLILKEIPKTKNNNIIFIFSANKSNANIYRVPLSVGICKECSCYNNNNIFTEIVCMHCSYRVERNVKQQTWTITVV